jgi:alpha-L-fucosidase 2
MTNTTLWFDRQATNFRESIPLGNGRLGAMIFGGVTEERIILNESSLWSGSAQESDRPDAHQALPEIRRLLLAGKNAEAETLVMERFVCQGAGSGLARGARLPFGCYQVLGNLHLSFHQNDPGEQNNTGYPPLSRRHYERALHLDRALMQMEYDLGGVRYRREALISAPAQVLVMRLSADRPGMISLRARLDRPECFHTQVDGSNGLRMTGQLENGVDGQGVRYACRVRVLASGGAVVTWGDTLEVRKADEVLVLVAAATNARTFAGRNLADEQAACLADLETACAQGWEVLLSVHTADYQAYYRRVSLRLGPAPSAVPDGDLTNRPTPERLQALALGAEDAGLAELYFNFGRYLLISSSRPGGLPANLQGI